MLIVDGKRISALIPLSLLTVMLLEQRLLPFEPLPGERGGAVYVDNLPYIDPVRLVL